jgi:hypothetical protein
MIDFQIPEAGFPYKSVNFGNALKQPADAQLGIEESKLKDSAGRQQQYLPRLRNLLPNRHPPPSDGATGLKQHSGVTGACFTAGLMPNWRRANCITNKREKQTGRFACPHRRETRSKQIE